MKISTTKILVLFAIFVSCCSNFIFIIFKMIDGVLQLNKLFFH